MLSYETTIYGHPAIATVEGEGTRIVVLYELEYAVNGVTIRVDVDNLSSKEHTRILDEMPEEEDNSRDNWLMNKADNDYKESRS